MVKFKFLIIIVLLFGLIFLVYNTDKLKNVKIGNICNDVSNLDVKLSVNKKLNNIEYYSANDIQRVIIFDANGDVICKESPKNNLISLDKIGEKELFISFISNDRIAFKSIKF